MRRLIDMDRPLIAMILLALLAGLVILYSGSARIALVDAPQGAGVVQRRLEQLVIGIGAMLLLAFTDPRWLRKLALPGAIVAGLLLVGVLATTAIRGTRGWLPVLGHSFQPVDVARVALILFLADRLARREDERGFKRRWLIPLIAVALASGLVALQPDYGSALAIGLCGAVLLVAARMPWRWVALGVLSLALLIGTAYEFSDRIRSRMDLPLQFDPQVLSPETYQLRQSLIGIGAGGLAGRGPGLGRQQGFLPDHHTDFIFAIVGEQYGLLGTLVLLALLVGIALRTLRIARGQREPFGRYLAAGVAGMIFIYSTLNIAVCLGLFPLTGVPLPFISHGGSALVMNLAAIGLVLSLSRQPEQARPLKRANREQREPIVEDLFGSGGA